MTTKTHSIKTIRWFDTVRDACSDLDVASERDKLIDTVVAAAEYYATIEADAQPHLRMVGKLEELISENSGLDFYYNGFHIDAVQVRKHLEMLQETYEARKYVWFQTDPDAKAEYGSKLTATDLRNYVKADDVVALLSDCVRLIADRQHVLENIHSSLTTRIRSLRAIVDIRVAKLEEVWVDGTQETNNT
jgi:hypothetical protein